MTLNTSNYEIYDLILLIVCLFVIIRGYRRGFLYQVYGLFVTIGSYFAAAFFYDKMSIAYPLTQIPLIGSLGGMLDRVLWFVILLIGVRWLLFLLRKLFFHAQGKQSTPVSVLNRLAGLIFGIIEAVVLVVIVFAFCQLPFVENGKEYKEISIFTIVEKQIVERVNFL